MPIRLSELSGFIPASMPVPQYAGGVGRIADSVAGWREEDRAKQRLALQEQQLAQQAIESDRNYGLGLGRQQISLGQQDISRGFLGIREQEMERQRQAEEQKAIANFTDAVTSPVQDPARIEAAKRALQAYGIDAAPPTPAQAAAEATMGAQAPPAALGQPAPSVATPPDSGGLMGELNQMESDVLGGMGQVPSAQPAAPPVGQPTESPAPTLGQAGAIPLAPPPPPPTPEIAAWRLKRGDEVLAELDPTTGNETRMKLVAETFAPLVARARSESERRAAGLAMEAASKAVAAGVPTKDALAAGEEAYQFEIEQDNALKRAQVSASGRITAASREFGSSGLGKDDYSIRADLASHADKIVSQVASQQRVTAITDTDREFAKLEALVDEKSGFADSNAVVSFITAMQERVSNADYQVAIGSGGVMNQLTNFVNRFDPRKAGSMGPHYMRQVRSAASALRSTMRKEKMAIAKQAEAQARARSKLLRLGPEDEELLVENVMTPFMPEGMRSQAPPPRGNRPIQQTPPAAQAPKPAGPNTKSLNERARKLGL